MEGNILNTLPSEFSYLEGLESSHAADVLRLFQGEWWCKTRSLEDVHRLLGSSSLTMGYLDGTGKLVAFSRILTDYFYFAFVFDLIVDEDYRGIGLGVSLLRRIIENPHLSTVQSLELCCQPERKGFYESFGFREASGRMRLTRPGADF